MSDLVMKSRGHLRTGVVVLVVLAGALGPGVLRAGAKREQKPTRLVTGVVLDASENPISGATVTLTDLQTGKKSASYTSDDGVYQFSGLEITRDYEVQAEHNGASSRVRRVSTVDPRRKVTFNLRIPPPKDEE